jgi:hypothetical protein
MFIFLLFSFSFIKNTIMMKIKNGANMMPTINDTNFDYDIELSNESLITEDNNISSLFEEMPNNYGIEAFKALLSPSIRIGRLFKLKTSTNEPPKSLMVLRKFTGVAFIPIVASTSEVIEETITCFGNAVYNRMMYNYIYPRLIRYKNPYMPGSKVVIKRSIPSQYNETIKASLPKMTNMPTFMIKNRRNSIIDLSDIISLTIPNRSMLMRPNAFNVSDKLAIQMISRLGFKIIPEEQPLYSNLKTTIPPIGSLFNSLIFSIKVPSHDIRLANQFLNISDPKIPLAIRKNPDSIFVLGLIRFILKVLDNRTMDESPLEQQLSDLIWQKEHVIFILHNDTHAFYIDPQEIKEKGIKYNYIFRLIRYGFKTLISLNNKTISPLDVDTESELSPEAAEAELDNKINTKEEVLDNTINEINDSEKSSEINSDNKNLLKEIDKENDDLHKEQIVNKVIAKSKFNVTRQKALGITASDKKSNINDIDDMSEEENYEENEDELLEDFMAELKKEEEEDSDTKEEDDAKEFLVDLAQENDEESKKQLIDQIKSSTTPQMTAVEKRRIEALQNKYKSIKYDNDLTMEEILAKANTQSIDINKSSTNIKDDSFNYCLLKDFTTSYIDKMMSRDILNSVKFFGENKSLDMYITGFNKKDVSDQLNNISSYNFELEDKNKQKHKVSFRLPNVDEDGFIYINGNRKYLKKQLVLRPVTKTKEDEVYLTSDYNKVRLYRQGTVLNRNTTLIKKIVNTMLEEVKISPQGELAANIHILRGNNHLVNSDYITTIEYDELGSFLHHIILFPKSINEIAFYFNQSYIRDEITKRNIEYTFSPSMIPIGIDNKINKVIDVNCVDSSDSVSEKIISYIIKSDIFPSVTDIISKTSVPKRRMYSRLEIQSRDVPLIVFLSSLFNFSKVIEIAGIKTYFVKNGEELPPEVKSDSLVNVIFSDGVLYYDQYPIENALLLNGLTELTTAVLDYKELDSIATYLDWMYDVFKTRNLYKGWTAFQELFLNPKTIECLEALKQPTDFLELLLYANSLLANNSYLDSADSRNWRARDYEIFNSLIYYTISHAYAEYKKKGKNRKGFSIPEGEVLKQINKSFVTANYDATNPLNELRERSSITYKGPIGINSDRTFSLDKRGQTRSTVGTIGLSSIDKSNTGIVKQLTINPRFISTLGFIDAPETDKDVNAIPTSSLMTAEESMLPFVNRDDPKRIGFASGQTKHVIPSDYFTPQVIGTGFEQTIAYKIGNDFGYKAKKDGQVVAVNDKENFAVIKYNDNTSERVNFGEQYHRNSDFFLSNNLSLNIKEGDLVKKGELITYNKDFFKKHIGKLMYTQGVVARIAVTEGEVTEEDSSGISQRLANKLTSSVIKRNQIALNANANIIESKAIGDHVIYGDPLIVFEDQKDEGGDLSLLSILGESDAKALDSISRHRASSDYTGEIIDIKIYWSVPPEEMSESCSAFVKKYIRKINKEISFEENATKIKSKRNVATQVTTPQLDRIHGMEITRTGGILIEYYIKHSVGKRSGDKVTMNSSLKSILCQIFPDELAPRRLDGRFKQIDMIFSFIGINARMVTSVWFSGFVSKIVVEEGKKFAGEFFDEIGEDLVNILESSLEALPA